MPCIENYYYEVNFSLNELSVLKPGDVVDFDGIDGFYDREGWIGNQAKGEKFTALMCPVNLPTTKDGFYKLNII